MNNVTWLEDGSIKIAPPAHPKKLTGTRFATILGLNPWSTPFEIWCAVTRTWEKPFEDTIYTVAGKTIEPKQAEYMRKSYFMRDLVTPTAVFGEDYFRKTRGDFFPAHDVLGGMWDYLRIGKDGKPHAVLEMKTTKRSEDWGEDIPEYYALQAALYAYLLGVDEVIMVCSFLGETDYADPGAFVCSAQNTIVRPFRVSERYPSFEEDYVKPALAWWAQYVESGISPAYDEKKDAEALKALRTNNVDPAGDLEGMIAEAEELKAKLDKNANEIAEDEKRYKALADAIKAALVKQLRPGETKANADGKRYHFTVTVSQRTELDKEAMKKDGILEKYQIAGKPTYTLKPTAIKEG